MSISLTALDRREVLRYLGYGSNLPDPATAALLDSCEQELLAAAVPRYCYRIFPLIFTLQGVLLEGTNLILPGRDIAAHLAGCDRAALLSATLSQQAEQLIARAGVTDMSRCLVLDSLATAAVEQLCDRAEREIFSALEETSGKEVFFASRFSPGYGDLPLSLQSKLLALLDAPRRIGLCATREELLTPKKSVTALIGISSRPLPPKKRGCAVCNLKDTCPFRKRGDHCGTS